MKKFRRQKPEQADNHADAIKKSVFRSFAETEFLPYHSWNQLEQILESSNGGAYGISGPRGSGKTWLISNSVEWARKNNGVGLWFPTPSDYGAEPFLSALADNFASEVQRKYPRGTPQWYTRFSSYWTFIVSAALFMVSIYFTGRSGRYFDTSSLINNMKLGSVISAFTNEIGQGAPQGVAIVELSYPANYILW